MLTSALMGLAQIHLDLPGMVEQYPVGSAIVDTKAKIEGNGGIHGDCVLVMSLMWINIPDRECLAALVHAAGTFTQAIDMFLARKLTRQP